MQPELTMAWNNGINNMATADKAFELLINICVDLNCCFELLTNICFELLIVSIILHIDSYFSPLGENRPQKLVRKIPVTDCYYEHCWGEASWGERGGTSPGLSC
jgi:hypothetical protein